MLQRTTLYSLKRGQRKGLSLIEVMVAVVIFSFLSASLYLLLRSGISVKKKLGGEGQRAERIYLVLDRLSQNIHNLVPFTPEDTGFRGKESGLSFYNLGFDYRGARPQLSFLEYKLEDGDLKQISNYPLPLAEKEDKDAQEIVLLEGLDKLAISYLQREKYEWKENWEQGRELPRGVRIDIGYKDSRGREKSLSKYVFIYR